MVLACEPAGPSSGADVLVRFFAPWAGIDEDPATGSACTVSCPFWADRLGGPTGRALRVGVAHHIMGCFEVCHS